jgi:hypothetical protein
LKKIFFLLLFLVLNTKLYATAEALLLISEMESLYKDLPELDKSKLPLTYKLADLHFNQATIDKDEGIDKFQAFASATKYYKLILAHPQLKESAQREMETLNIHFQLGRLYHRFKEYEESISYFSQVFEHSKSTVVLKKESALFLAELYETLANLDKAESYYQKAISLCSDVYSCSYIHFKLAWTFYRSERLDDALSSMEKTLFDQSGNLQEKSLRDYLLFSAQKGESFSESIDKVSAVEKQSGRKDLLEILGHNFYAAGNRTAGTKVFSLLNQEEKKYRQQLRLLEEYYGDRNFESYNLILTQLESSPTLMPTEEVEKVESLNTFRRLIVQLDGERKTNEKALPYLLRTISAYLKFYPFDEMREKMVNGWINANSDKLAAIDFLSSRVKEEVLSSDGKAREKEWRLKRLVNLQDTLETKYPLPENRRAEIQRLLLEDASKLAVLDADKSRKWNYILAKSYYDQKKNEDAKPLFLSLADLSKIDGNIIDEYAIKSQNLILDIYNQEKNFAGISLQIAKWTENQDFNSSKDKNLASERESQIKLGEEARFENLVSKGNSVEALEQFIILCKDKKYAEKSCANAKSIAQSLNDRKALLAIYEIENDLERLEVEYEYQGHFAKAAALKEKKLGAQSSNSELLTVAVLYELEAQYTDRDRVINQLLKRLSSRKTEIPKEEAKLLFGFFQNTGFMKADLLNLKWNSEDYTYLLSFLHDHQLLSAKEEQKFYQMPKNLGPDWEKNKVSALINLYNEQKKISFYGANSRSLFTKRVSKLSKLKDNTNIFLDSASAEGQFLTLAILEKSYFELASEIESTPLPAGLTEEELAQVNEGLKSLAEPFKTETENYKKLKDELVAKVVDKAKMEQAVSGELSNYLSFYDTSKKTYEISRVAESELKEALLSFQTNPLASQNNEKMISFFENKKQLHLAVFMKGRLETLKGQSQETGGEIKK